MQGVPVQSSANAPSRGPTDYVMNVPVQRQILPKRQPESVITAASCRTINNPVNNLCLCVRHFGAHVLVNEWVQHASQTSRTVRFYLNVSTLLSRRIGCPLLKVAANNQSRSMSNSAPAPVGY
jgi:hypothetical protein